MATAEAKRKEPPIDSIPVPPDQSPFKNRPDPRVEDAMPDMPKSKADTELILKAMLQSYATMGMAVSFFAPADGMVVVANAEDLAESWRSLLDNDPKVRRILKKAIQGSGWGAVISAHLTVAVAIVKNHPEGMSHLIKRKPSDDDETVSAN